MDRLLGGAEGRVVYCERGERGGGDGCDEGGRGREVRGGMGSSSIRSRCLGSGGGRGAHGSTSEGVKQL